MFDLDKKAMEIFLSSNCTLGEAYEKAKRLGMPPEEFEKIFGIKEVK